MRRNYKIILSSPNVFTFILIPFLDIFSITYFDDPRFKWSKLKYKIFFIQLLKADFENSTIEILKIIGLLFNASPEIVSIH